MYGNAVIGGSAQIKDWALVRGNAVICGSAQVKHSAIVEGNAIICGESRITHSAKIMGSSVIEDSTVRSEAQICDAKIKFCVFKGRSVINGGNYYNKQYDGEFWV